MQKQDYKTKWEVKINLKMKIDLTGLQAQLSAIAFWVWICFHEVQNVFVPLVCICKQGWVTVEKWQHWAQSTGCVTDELTLFLSALVSAALSHTPVQRWVGQLLGLACIKADGRAHVVNTSHTHTHEGELSPRGASKPNSPTPANRHLSESEMATFVSVSFPSHQHSGLSTAPLRHADLCSGGLFRPVLTLCNSGGLVPLMGLKWLLGCEECWRAR